MTLPAAFGKVDEILYASPATQAGFTAAEINGLESGMENV
jgi:hypothetical protein